MFSLTFLRFNYFHRNLGNNRFYYIFQWNLIFYGVLEILSNVDIPQACVKLNKPDSVAAGLGRRLISVKGVEGQLVEALSHRELLVEYRTLEQRHNNGQNVSLLCRD